MNRYEERLVDTLDSLYWLNQKTPGIPAGDLKSRLSRLSCLSSQLDWEQINLFRLRDEGQLKLYYRNDRIWVVSRHSAMDRPN